MENTTVKKPRALPRVWARYFRLKVGDTFFPTEEVPLRNLIVVTKRGPFWFTSGSGKVRFIAPWKKVRTTVYVRDVLKGGAVGDPSNPMNESAKRWPHHATIPFNGNRDIKPEVRSDSSSC